jgi:hypothetical protein
MGPFPHAFPGDQADLEREAIVGGPLDSFKISSAHGTLRHGVQCSRPCLTAAAAYSRDGSISIRDGNATHEPGDPAWAARPLTYSASSQRSARDAKGGSHPSASTAAM